MRYYLIIITDPVTKKEVKRYSSLAPDGQFIPGALQVEFDIPIVGYGNPGSGGYLRIWGVSLQDISQANNLNDKLIAVYAGMSNGLPLANPNQQGPLMEGFIFQAYGNWVGTVQTLDFNVIPGQGPAADTNNFTFNYKKGSPFAQAIQTTLQIAYPYLSVDVSGVSADLVLAQDQQGQYTTLQSFAKYLKEVSKAISPPTSTGLPYYGVEVFFKGGQIVVKDNSAPPSDIKDISFKDLIGQPTWNSPVTFQFNAVLRGDLSVGDYIRMPISQFTSVPQSLSRFRDNSGFQGVAQIIGEGSCIRHVGNSRQPDGMSWITTVNCVVPPA